MNTRQAASAEDPDTGPQDGSEQGRAAVMVKPVINAIRILRYLSQAGKPARAIQIARHLSINASTCFNILRTLVSEDVIAFDALSKTYTIGFGLAKLVDLTLTDRQRVTVARPVMQAFASRYGVAVSFWRRVGADRMMLVAIEHSPADVRIHLTEGQRLPLLMGSSGRVLAAHSGLSKAELKAAFKSLRWQTQLSFDAYAAQIDQAHERGFAVDDGYFTRGVTTVAAPVFDGSGAIAFAISAAMFQGQYDIAGIEEIGRALSELGPSLSALLY